MNNLIETSKLSTNFEIINRYIKVVRSSDSELKKHLNMIGKYFAKEFNYGPSYDYERQINKENIGYLFVDGETVFGGCGFSKLPITSEDIWCLEWVWLHPFYRHRGKFTYYWNIFIQEYLQIGIKVPISCEMQEFLKKQDNITIQGSLDKELGHIFVERREVNV